MAQAPPPSSAAEEVIEKPACIPVTLKASTETLKADLGHVTSPEKQVKRGVSLLSKGSGRGPDGEKPFEKLKNQPGYHFRGLSEGYRDNRHQNLDHNSRCSDKYGEKHPKNRKLTNKSTKKGPKIAKLANMSSDVVAAPSVTTHLANVLPFHPVVSRLNNDGIFPRGLAQETRDYNP